MFARYCSQSITDLLGHHERFGGPLKILDRRTPMVSRKGEQRRRRRKLVAPPF